MIEILNEYCEKGLVRKQSHPTLPLIIWNYTPTVQYDNLWDEITIQTRGLITDNEGNVIARPFKKFFNLEEGKFTPTSEFEVFSKMDGSLGIMFLYSDQMVCATRGSFNSDQSIWMYNFAKKHNYQNIIVDGYTYLFEIIYPENRVCVNYGNDERLVLLSIINTKTGQEIEYDNFFEQFDIVKKFNGIKDYTFLKGMVRDNEEGFVVRFSNGDRVKIKGEEYLRLHKIMTNVSTTSIWEMVSLGLNIDDFLSDVPDEFYKKIKSYVSDLKYSYVQISEYCGKLHDGFRYGKFNDKEIEPTKKEFAEFVKTNIKKELQPIMFSMWEEKPYNQIIWRLIKPKYEKL